MRLPSHYLVAVLCLLLSPALSVFGDSVRPSSSQVFAPEVRVKTWSLLAKLAVNASRYDRQAMMPATQTNSVVFVLDHVATKSR